MTNDVPTILPTTGNDPGHVEASETTGTSPPRAVGNRRNAEGAPSFQDVRRFAESIAHLPPDERQRVKGKIDLYVALTPGADLSDAVGRLEFERDIAVIMEGGIEPPPVVIPDLIYEEAVFWFSGHPGEGKTTLAMDVARQWIKRGKHVLWLDWEGTKRSTLARLQAVGVSSDLAGEFFHLAASPEIEASERGLARIAPWLAEWPGALVVIDSASKALGHAGLDENSAIDVTKWTTRVVMPIRELGATAVVIDHVPKGANEHDRYARGSGTKLADADAAWYVKQTKLFSRDRIGEITLTRKKDRESVLPPKVVFEVGDGRGSLTLRKIKAGSDEERAEGQNEIVRNRVRTKLAEHDGDELSGSQVVGMVVGAEKAIRDALKELANDPAEAVNVRPVGKSLMYRFDAAVALALPIA